MPGYATPPACHPATSTACQNTGFPLTWKPVPGSEVFCIVLVCVLLLLLQHFALRTPREAETDE